jgi:3-polyprenyl-4-hydroxybenzoate decarboxylase
VSDTQRLILGISGSPGMVCGIRLLQLMRDLAI